MYYRCHQPVSKTESCPSQNNMSQINITPAQIPRKVLGYVAYKETERMREFIGREVYCLTEDDDS
jgi:hypothetical protein